MAQLGWFSTALPLSNGTSTKPSPQLQFYSTSVSQIPSPLIYFYRTFILFLFLFPVYFPRIAQPQSITASPFSGHPSTTRMQAHNRFVVLRYIIHYLFSLHLPYHISSLVSFFEECTFQCKMRLKGPPPLLRCLIIKLRL